MGDLQRICDCGGECSSSGARHFRELADQRYTELQSVKKDYVDQTTILKETVEELKQSQDLLKELSDDAEESDRELLARADQIKGLESGIKIISNKNDWLWKERDRLLQSVIFWKVCFWASAVMGATLTTLQVLR